MNGYIKLHRKTLDNPLVCKDAEHLAVWCYLLCNAAHKRMDVMFNGKRKTLEPGELVTGRKAIANFLKINESKVQRILKSFESEQQIEQQTNKHNRLIKVVNWALYQSSEQQNEQQVNNKRTTSEQPVNTNKNDKNYKNDKNNIYINMREGQAPPLVSQSPPKPSKAFVKPTLEEVKAYCSERNNSVNAEQFLDYYEARGWELGKGRKVKDWKACVRTWERSAFNTQAVPKKADKGGKEYMKSNKSYSMQDLFPDVFTSEKEQK